MEKRIEDLAALEVEAVALALRLRPQGDSATLVALSGELGAGKTAFTKAIAKALGVGEVVNSPTFVLEKIYTLTSQPFKRLVHIDAYRLESGAELGALGFDALMKDPENLVLLEWPERVRNVLQKPSVEITITTNEDGSRTFTYA